MTDTSNGWPWTVLEVEHYKNGRRMGDGDTFNARCRTKQPLGRKWHWVEDDEFVGCRLAWVDTPEKTDPDYALAAKDLTNWIMRKLAIGPLTVYAFGSAGWDRELVDLIAADGESASQWMMTTGGWPLYVKGQ